MIKQISIPCIDYSVLADLHEGQSMSRIILTFVGFGSSKKSNYDFMAKIVEMTGASALVVDLSGHGESPFDVNDTTPAQHLLEAVKVYDWITARYPSSDICVMGTSYGGCIAAYLTRFRRTKKLVLRTPAIYESSMFYTEHRHIDKILVREYRKNTKFVRQNPLFLQSAIGDVATLLIVHGKDESIPPQTTDVYEESFSAARYMAKDFAHAFRDPSNPQDTIADYYDVVASWFRD